MNLWEITQCHFLISQHFFNSSNLFYSPRRGGVFLHADDGVFFLSVGYIILRTIFFFFLIFNQYISIIQYFNNFPNFPELLSPIRRPGCGLPIASDIADDAFYRMSRFTPAVAFPSHVRGMARPGAQAATSRRKKKKKNRRRRLLRFRNARVYFVRVSRDSRTRCYLWQYYPLGRELQTTGLPGTATREIFIGRLARARFSREITFRARSREIMWKKDDGRRRGQRGVGRGVRAGVA